MWRYCNSEKKEEEKKKDPHPSLYIHGIHGLGGSFTMALLVAPPSLSNAKDIERGFYAVSKNADVASTENEFNYKLSCAVCV